MKYQVKLRYRLLIIVVYGEVKTGEAVVWCKT